MMRNLCKVCGTFDGVASPYNIWLSMGQCHGLLADGGGVWGSWGKGRAWVLGRLETVADET